MARFEATVKRGKGRELWFYCSPLLRLLRKTTDQLRVKYCKKSKKPDWYVHVTGLYRVFGIQNVPKKEFPLLQKIFEKYIGRELMVKPHKHQYILVKKDQTWIWLKCKGCDAIDQVIFNNYTGIARKVIWPYWRSLRENKPLYQTSAEKSRIRQFIAKNKELVLINAAKELDCAISDLVEMAEKAKTEEEKNLLQKQIQALQKEREEYRMANLVL